MLSTRTVLGWLKFHYAAIIARCHLDFLPGEDPNSEPVSGDADGEERKNGLGNGRSLADEPGKCAPETLVRHQRV